MRERGIGCRRGPRKGRARAAGKSSAPESGAGLPAAQWWAIAVEHQRPDYVYVSGSDGVFFSRDGGSSWRRLGRLGLSMTAALAVNETGVYAGGTFGIHRIDRPDTPDGVFGWGFEPD